MERLLDSQNDELSFSDTQHSAEVVDNESQWESSGWAMAGGGNPMAMVTGSQPMAMWTGSGGNTGTCANTGVRESQTQASQFSAIVMSGETPGGETQHSSTPGDTQYSAATQGNFSAESDAETLAASDYDLAAQGRNGMELCAWIPTQWLEGQYASLSDVIKEVALRGEEVELKVENGETKVRISQDLWRQLKVRAGKSPGGGSSSNQWLPATPQEKMIQPAVKSPTSGPGNMSEADRVVADQILGEWREEDVAAQMATDQASEEAIIQEWKWEDEQVRVKMELDGAAKQATPIGSPAQSTPPVQSPPHKKAFTAPAVPVFPMANAPEPQPKASCGASAVPLVRAYGREPALPRRCSLNDLKIDSEGYLTAGNEWMRQYKAKEVANLVSSTCDLMNTYGAMGPKVEEDVVFKYGIPKVFVQDVSRLLIEEKLHLTGNANPPLQLKYG